MFANCKSQSFHLEEGWMGVTGKYFGRRSTWFYSQNVDDLNLQPINLLDKTLKLMKSVLRRSSKQTLAVCDTMCFE